MDQAEQLVHAEGLQVLQLRGLGAFTWPCGEGAIAAGGSVALVFPEAVFLVAAV